MYRNREYFKKKVNVFLGAFSKMEKDSCKAKKETNVDKCALEQT